MTGECSAYTESHGFRCVSFLDCDEDSTILSDGNETIAIRFAC